MPPKKTPKINYHDPPTMVNNRRVYVDKFGYLRYYDNESLVHREVAFEKYSAAPNLYPLDFKKYVIHHKNGNKWDNRPCNLALLTENQHRKVHPHLKNKKIH